MGACILWPFTFSYNTDTSSYLLIQNTVTLACSGIAKLDNCCKLLSNQIFSVNMKRTCTILHYFMFHCHIIHEYVHYTSCFYVSRNKTCLCTAYSSLYRDIYINIFNILKCLRSHLLNRWFLNRTTPKLFLEFLLLFVDN